MESQPNEIVTYILSYLDNRELNLARRVSIRWKMLIEIKLFHETKIIAKTIPPPHVCILTNDYYHFGKHYLNYNYELMNPCTPYWDINYRKACAKLSQLMGNSCFEQQIEKNCEKVSDLSLLIFSTYHNYLEIIQYLNPTAEFMLNTFLEISAEEGHLEIVKYLISKGVDIHYKRDTALQWSVYKNNINVVKYLVEQGADIHVRDEMPLHYCVQHGYFELMKYLIEQGANIHSQNNYALRESVGRKNVEMTKYLIQMGADRNAVTQTGNLSKIEFIKSLD